MKTINLAFIVMLTTLSQTSFANTYEGTTNTSDPANTPAASESSSDAAITAKVKEAFIKEKLEEVDLNLELFKLKSY